jgi:hypothetical protein
MGASLFITLERDVPGIDAGTVIGKALSRNLDWLDQTCERLSVRKLGELISVNPGDAASFLDGEGGTPMTFLFPQNNGSMLRKASEPSKPCCKVQNPSTGQIKICFRT